MVIESWTTSGLCFSRTRKSRCFRAIVFFVQKMADAAMGLKVWTESRPETALSWLPRMMDRGLRVRILWMTSFGEAP